MLFLCPVLIAVQSFGIVVSHNLDFYVGYGNQDELKDHTMYDQFIGVYHRRKDNKFCTGKPAGFYAMGICKKFYAHCTDHALSVMFCDDNYVFRSEDSKCVHRSMEPKCPLPDYIRDHSHCIAHPEVELVDLGGCSRTYGVCSERTLYYVNCPVETETFSEYYGVCVPKYENPGCDQRKHSKYGYHGTAANGPEANGPEANGPGANGPGANGPGANGPGANGPGANGPEANGPGANGPGANGPGGNGPGVTMVLERPSIMCQKAGDGEENHLYLGPCNKKFLYCGRDGYTIIAECKDKDKVADAKSGACVPISESSMCPQNWDGGSKDETTYVEHMNTMLNSAGSCKGKANGMYFDPFSECRREAVFCYQGHASFHLCPPGTGIDSNGWCSQKPACTEMNPGHTTDHEPWRSNALTVLAADAQLCQRTQADGIHVFGQCQNFYGHCHKGHFEIRTCLNPEEIFDPELNQCRAPKASDHCGTHNGKDQDQDQSQYQKPSRCSSESEKDLVATGDCEPMFLTCMNGWETNFECERKGYAFNEQEQKCIPKTRHERCPEYEMVVEPSPQGSCHGDGGFHVHEIDCTKFYRCAHGRLIEMSCANGTAFDPEINVCNHKHLVARCKENDKKSSRDGGSGNNFK